MDRSKRRRGWLEGDEAVDGSGRKEDREALVRFCVEEKVEEGRGEAESGKEGSGEGRSRCGPSLCPKLMTVSLRMPSTHHAAAPVLLRPCFAPASRPASARFSSCLTSPNSPPPLVIAHLS